MKREDSLEDRDEQSQEQDRIESKSRMIGEMMRIKIEQEALILWMICYLESPEFKLRKSSISEKATKQTINDLRTILDFLRDKEFRERSKLYYLVCDLVEIAQLTQDSFKLEHYQHKWIGEIKIRILESGVDVVEAESAERSENVGEGEENGEDVMGLEDDVKLLVEKAILRSVKRTLTTLIKGMVGSGKTSLARQVYNHAAVVAKFKHRAWVHVSDLSYKEILMKLALQLGVFKEHNRALLLEKLELLDNRALQRGIHQCLQGKPHLVVLDDWPNVMHLDSILKALPRDGMCRLMLTSHSKCSETIYYIHEMKPLPPDISWKLFLKTVSSCGDELTSDQNFPKHLEKMGKEMVKKLGGVPLVIKVVGRQLAEKRQLEGSAWETLLESIDPGAYLESLENFYRTLDEDVKSGFLHLAFFKQNTTIRTKKLQGILSAGGMALYDVNKKLMDHSIIEVKGKSTYQGIKTCRINPILHSLAIKKAEEEIDFEILNNVNGNNRTSQNPRHRVMVCSRETFNYSTNQDKHLVSLLFHGGGYLDTSASYWKSFEKLRILDLEDFGLKSVPETIGTLGELRYLGLRNNHIRELPKSLGCLKLLELLDIAQNYLVEVPDIIWEMCSLRYLYMSDVTCRKPLKINELQHLRTLTYISVDNWTFELQMMRYLSKLGIEEIDGNTDVSKLLASLAEIEYLRKLTLRGFRFKGMPCLDKLCVLRKLTKLTLDGRLVRLPSAENFPPNLVYLRLINSRLEEDPMPILGRLPNLACLKLRNAYTGQQMLILNDGFPKLQQLAVKDMWNLRNVCIQKDGARGLNETVVQNCPYLNIFRM